MNPTRTAKCKHCSHSEDAHTSHGCAECGCPMYARPDCDAQEAAIPERARGELFPYRFHMGRMRTLRPDDALETGAIDPWDIIHLLNNHQRGWWGSISAEQPAANEAALQEGGTVVSCYPYGGGMCITITTDIARRETTMVLAPIAEGRPQ